MAAWNIAVVGAQGQVGSALVSLLQSRQFPVDSLFLVEHDDNEGEVVRFSGKNITVKSIETFDWHQCHFALFVAGRGVSEKYARIVAETGCIVIDASGFATNDDNIPLIVPNVNNHVLAEYRNENIVVVANEVVCQLLSTLTTLTDTENLTQLHMTNFVPASFFGKQGIDELAGQSARLLNGLPADNVLFDHQLAFNLLPLSLQMMQKTTALSLAEHNIVEQIRKITANYQLAISMDSVVVPVFYGLSQSVAFTSSMPIELDHDSLTPHRVVLSEQIPTPVTEVNAESSEEPVIKVANLRYSYGNQAQVQFWSVADNIRYLGAAMILNTLEILINDYM